MGCAPEGAGLRVVRRGLAARLVFAPGALVEGHEAAGHEGVAAQEDGNVGFGGEPGEVAEEGVGDCRPVPQVGEEAVFAGSVDARVGEEGAGVGEGGGAWWWG